MLTDFISRIDSILSSKKITQRQIIKDLNLSQNIFTSWRNGATPNIATFCKIADYLEVSVEYLATGNDDSLSLEQQQLINDFFSLPIEYQNIIKSNIKAYQELCYKLEKENTEDII